MSRRQPHEQAVRRLVLAVPDWPTVAAGFLPHEPAAVLVANRVIAATPAARAAGVETGLRRREAQARCPDVVVVEADPARDAREFEPVVATLADLCPRLEVFGPGRCGFPTRGPSRYFGGDAALADRARQTVQAMVGERAAVRVGVADGLFAATLASESSIVDADASSPDRIIVEPGASATWLASLPVTTLAQPDEPDTDKMVPTDLVDLVTRLGLRTLGAVAALPIGDLAARFGPPGVVAHRLASGFDMQPPNPTPPPADLAVEVTFEPPVERVDTAAFAARSLAEELHQRLSDRGEACTHLLVVAETEHSERMERCWYHGTAMSAGTMAERVRWQLDGWLHGSSTARPTAGITLLRLAPEEVVAAVGTQLRLWDTTDTAPEKVVRAVARLGGLLGPEAVTVPEWRGGRQPDEHVATVPAGAVDLDGNRTATEPPMISRDPDLPPWPGRLPAPSPALVFAPCDQPPVTLSDDSGALVQVDGRARCSSSPAELCVNGNDRQRVVAWAGPWPVVERWWDPTIGRRQIRLQVLTDDGVASLLVLEQGQWSLAAVYD